MRTLLSSLMLAALVLGCQAKPASHAGAATPAVIASLTDQKVVWTCPECGMDYAGPGKCAMCNVDLVKESVAYICPADNQAVEHAGKCPRCDANAKVVKTVVAEAAPSGGAEAKPSGATSGS